MHPQFCERAYRRYRVTEQAPAIGRVQPRRLDRWFADVVFRASDLSGELGRLYNAPGVDGAREFLEDILADGPQPASEVRRQAIEAGVKYGVLYRARERMGIDANSGNWSLGSV